MKGKGKLKADLGLRLQKLLLQKDLSIRGLAARSGLEYSQLQKIVSGQVNITLKTVEALAVGLNMSVAELFSEFK